MLQRIREQENYVKMTTGGHSLPKPGLIFLVQNILAILTDCYAEQLKLAV